MRTIILSLLAAAFVPAFTARSDAGTPAPSGKAPVSTADSAWSSTILGFGVKTNDKYTEGNVFLTVPLISTIGRDGKLGGDYIFIEPYSSVGEGGEVAASLGLAWRHLFSNQSVSALQNKGRASFMEEGWFLGGNLFIDMLDTEHNNQFWQLGVGAEVGNRYLQLTGNYYIPLTGRELADRNVSTQSFSNTSNSTKLTSAGDPFATGNEILQNATYTTYANTTTTTVRTVTELYEKGMEGWDAQLAVLVPWLDQWVDLKLIGGYFSFDNQPFGPQKGGTGNVHGWKAGAEFRPVPAVLLSAMWYQDERLTGNDWTMGLQLQVPLGKDWKDSFRPRRRHLVEQLAEPVHRQNDAVKIGNEKEVASTSSVKRTTRVVKQTPTRLVLKDDVIFVNNGPAVGNGIQAGDEQTGDGTAEKPKAIIQSGADIAQAKSISTGRVWNVYTQGNSTPYNNSVFVNRTSVNSIGSGTSYNENVLVNTGSVNFIGSGSPITGQGGKNFGTGPGPVVEGGFDVDSVETFGITGYTINSGTSSPGGGQGVFASNVESVNIYDNTFNNISTNAVDLRTSRDSSLTAFVIGNSFNNALGDYIHTESADTSTLFSLVLDNTFNSATGDAIRSESFDSSSHGLVALFNEINNQVGNGIHVLSHDNSALYAIIGLNAINNTFLDAILAEADNTGASTEPDGANLFINASSNIIDGTGSGNGISLKASNNAILYADPFEVGPLPDEATPLFSGISKNTITNPAAQGIYLEALNTAVIDATVTDNTITGGKNAIFASNVRTADFIANTIRDSIDRGIFIVSTGTNQTVTKVIDNTLIKAGANGLEVVSQNTATIDLTTSNNLIDQSTSRGVILDNRDTSTLDVKFNLNTITSSAIDGLYVDKSGSVTLSVTGTLDNLIGPHSGGKRVNFESGSPTVSFFVNGVLITTPTDVP